MPLAARQRSAPPGGRERPRESGRPTVEAQGVRQRQVKARRHATAHGCPERVQQFRQVAHSDTRRCHGRIVISESALLPLISYCNCSPREMIAF